MKKKKSKIDIVPIPDLTYGWPLSAWSITVFSLLRCKGLRPRTFFPTTDNPKIRKNWK